jgi:hypothetical protein
VTETLRGSPHRLVPVWYGTAFVDDVSTIQWSREYLLFLSGRYPIHKLSWFDWSAWRIEQGRAQAIRREWLKRPPIEMATFRNGLNSQAPSDDSLAR